MATVHKAGVAATATHCNDRHSIKPWHWLPLLPDSRQQLLHITATHTQGNSSRCCIGCRYCCQGADSTAAPAAHDHTRWQHHKHLAANEAPTAVAAAVVCQQHTACLSLHELHVCSQLPAALQVPAGEQTYHSSKNTSHSSSSRSSSSARAEAVRGLDHGESTEQEHLLLAPD
jgi:hypothetical protein